VWAAAFSGQVLKSAFPYLKGNHVASVVCAKSMSTPRKNAAVEMKATTYTWSALIASRPISRVWIPSRSPWPECENRCASVFFFLMNCSVGAWVKRCDASHVVNVFNHTNVLALFLASCLFVCLLLFCLVSCFALSVSLVMILSSLWSLIVFMLSLSGSGQVCRWPHEASVLKQQGSINE